MNIYALSSGRGPSGIAIVRISGKNTFQVCKNLTQLKQGNKQPQPTLILSPKNNHQQTMPYFRIVHLPKPSRSMTKKGM